MENLLKDLERKAQTAHNWTSFSPEKRGTQMVNDYGTELNGDVEELKSQDIPEDVINEYISRYKRFFSSWISSKSNCASSMITGPANFNVRKHEKANRSEQRHYEVFREWRLRAKKAICRKEKEPTTYLSEIDRYKAELVSMQKNHDLMKEGNIRIKNAKKTGEDLTKYLTDVFNIAPHMIEWAMKFGFGLTNNNANMKRVEQRIKELEAKEVNRNSEQEKGYTFEGGNVVLNYELDRIQVFFDVRQTKEQLDEWKRKGLSGFNWSPSNGCWQRKITNNALWVTKRMLGL
jgi:hypothetical protein